MPNSSLNNPNVGVSESHFERAEIDGIEFIKDVVGDWRYADSWILVPGARDVTLTERFHPKRIVNAAQEVERVVVSGDDIAAAPELLDWCIAEGTPITEEGELIEVLVPYELWQARDRIPGQLISPEHHGSEAERQVAAAEREFREAEQQLDKAASDRAEVLRRHDGEMTRQEARAITDLSVGRIQQLIRGEANILAPDLMHAAQLDQTLLLLATRQPKSMDALHELLTEEVGTTYRTNFIRRKITALMERGLLRVSGSKGVTLTIAGEEFLRESRRAGRPSLLDEASRGKR